MWAAAERVDTARKVAFLASAAAWGQSATQVEVIETHVSWLFFSGDLACKLKKPVLNRDFDFRTVGARRRNALAELRLNRRLAPAVYLDVIPLLLCADGALSLTRPGWPVDWLLRMRRLPRAAQLDLRIAAGGLEPDALAPLSALLTAFYRALPAEQPPATEFTAHFAEEIRISREQLLARSAELPADRIGAVAAGLGSFLAARPALFAERLAAGRVVEGHGDLRPEHIFLVEPPAIIDCLEFSRRLRTLDIVDELGFLAMECERLGCPWAAAQLLGDYRDWSGDDFAPELLAFYQAFRALIRARLAANHLAEVPVGERGKWLDRTRVCLRLAAGRLGQFQGEVSGSSDSPR